MRHPPFAEPMVQADFGPTTLSGLSLRIVRNYRLLLAVLVSSLLLCHLPLTNAPLAIFGALLVCLIYVVVRARLPLALEDRLHEESYQFWRAQAAIAVVTLFLLILGFYGQSGSLWVLYLPALSLISRYCARQRSYASVALETTLLAVTVYAVELRHAALTPLQLTAELGGRAIALALASFLVHYVARVHLMSRRNAALRNQVVHTLLQRVLLETRPLALWDTIREACRTAVNASGDELYLYDPDREQLQRLEQVGEEYRLGSPIFLSSEHLAARAIQQRALIEEEHSPRRITLAAPLYGQPEHDGNPLAVILLRVQVANPIEQRAVQLFLTDLLEHIWPICTYAGIRQQFPRLYQIDNGEVHSLALDDVLDVVLDTVCSKLGFSFATISLVNEDQQTIGTVRGRHVPEGWIAESHHPLDSHDIQADVLRNGKVEVIDGWDQRFDPEIWEKYKHAELVRIWVPLGRIGTIEAGFYKCERKSIPHWLAEVLRRYARDVTVGIQNAQLYEREQRHNAVLTRLHELSAQLQTDPRQRAEPALLKDLVQAALDILGASNVILHPLTPRDTRFAAPIYVGEIIGSQPLLSADASTNIVCHIADTCTPYYQPDAQQDALLVGTAIEPYVSKRHHNPSSRTFTQRQHIRSFAGVPLLARGELLGVLCANFRERHQFSHHDRQLLTLFAQAAATVIASGRLVRERERRRLEYDLHDTVKSSVRSLILFSKAAADMLESDPERARQHLHEVHRVAWGILSDVNMILNDLSPQGQDRQSLYQLICDDLQRVIGRNNPLPDLELDPRLPALPLMVARTLLYLIREAVVNARDHGKAGMIAVSIYVMGERIQLVVKDNGGGFDPQQAASNGHRGLAIMRDRAEELGGRLTIMSSLGGGTTVSVELPQKEEGDDLD